MTHLHLSQQIKHVSPGTFPALAVDVFRYQSQHCPLYVRYLSLLGRKPSAVQCLEDIPFLPVQFFKNYGIQTGSWREETVFSSSGTTGQTPSRHLVRHLGHYLDNTVRGFAHFYGHPSGYCVLALLPSYLEREGSSLVAMADHFIRLSKYPESGFFLNDHQKLCDTLIHCQSKGYPTLLLGVSFGLLDFAEAFPMSLAGITVMETGGMKGRRREMTRPELHATLCEAFQIPAIHSEYGMTELLSQGYAQGGTVFRPAPTMRLVATELHDPFCALAPGKTGTLNIIDLANIDSCGFVATEDLGRIFPDGSTILIRVQ